MQGRKIIVTGAFGALGRAVVQALAQAGARVAAVDAVAPPAGFGADVVIGQVDLADATAAQTAVAQAVQKLGGLDGLVNVAGTFRWETVEGGSVDTWDLLYRINVRTALNASRAALTALQDGGAIVNVGAGAAAKAAAGMGAYTASKAGVAKLTEALADELKDKGIRVNAVLPSIIDTAANRQDMPDADYSRWVAPDALADAIVFLLSTQARAITGASLSVNGRM